MKKSIKVLSLVTALALTITGCGDFKVFSGVEDYTLMSPLTQSELIDYYSKALTYDSIVSRNLDVQQTVWETYEIKGDKAELLKSMTATAETILGAKEYDNTIANSKILSEDTYNYIRTELGDKKLSNGQVESVKGALGYYFVDIKYELESADYGCFTNKTSLLGINGAFVWDIYDNDTVDTSYIKKMVNNMNTYYAKNDIAQVMEYDEGSQTVSVKETEVVADENDYLEIESEPTSLSEIEGEEQQVDEDGNPITEEELTQEELEAQASDAAAEEEETDGEEAADGEEATEGEEAADGEEPQLDEDGNPIEDTFEAQITDEASLSSVENKVFPLDKSIRTSQLDTALINSVAGSSVRCSSYMPDIKLVYEMPESQGTISGTGIEAMAIGGLKNFGYDRGGLSGIATIRYVFKDALDGTGSILGSNAYFTDIEILSGFTAADKEDVLIPEFLLTEIGKLIENADRAMMNVDLTALMSGKIFNDMGVAVNRGYEDQHVNVLRQISTLRRVINRDIENNRYLVEVETTRQEGARTADSYGIYRDKYYMTIEQVDGEFRITDRMLMLRQMQTEPEIMPDSTTKKRLIALNLTGDISEETKYDAEVLMQDLYKACTNRVLNGPKDITNTNGETVTLEKGMYECFNDDPSMLSTAQREYFNSALRDRMTQYGIAVPSTIHGNITDWIGGANNQIEFITEEAIKYDGFGNGTYMQVYYLVSCMNDKWVIDDMKIIDTEEYPVNELDTIITRIEGNNADALNNK